MMESQQGGQPSRHDHQGPRLDAKGPRDKNAAMRELLAKKQIDLTVERSHVRAIAERVLSTFRRISRGE